MLRELIRETIYNRLGSLRQSPSDWQVCDCPVCIFRGHSADTRKRFGVKSDADGTLVVHCFNCALNAKYTPTRLLSDNFVDFLKQLGVSDPDIKKLKFQAFREKEAGEIFNKPKLSEDARSKWAPYALPTDSYPISTWLEAGLEDKNFITVASYCADRKVSLADAYWSPDTANFMNKRMIMPCTYRGEIVGYAGRLAMDKIVNKGMNRYYGYTPVDFVYNLDAQNNDFHYIIVCEGIIDAYFTGGVSSLGAMNQSQADIINSFRKKVIVCPDRDSDGGILIDVAIANGWGVSFPKWDADVKDVGKAVPRYGRILTLRSILETATTDVIKIKLNRKMDVYDDGK